MIKLFGQPAEEQPRRVEIDPAFKTVALAVGALMVIVAVAFWQGLLLLLIGAWDSRPNPILWFSLRSDTAYYGTPAWSRRAQRGVESGQDRPVLATRLTNNGQALLLTLSSTEKEIDPQTRRNLYSWTRTGDVYLYESERKSLQKVPVELWDEAGGEVLGCNSLDYLRTSWARVSGSQHENQVTIGGRKVELAGHLLVGTKQAPSEPLVAVVSAGGRRVGFGGIMFSGPGPVYGQHYHQVFSLKDRSLVGSTVRLPSRSSQFGESYPEICWSAGQRYVIIAKGYSGVSIIPVAFEGAAGGG
jgi:hypothetical protein